MIEIRTLGGVQLEAPAGRPGARPVASQPKRFALLVYLAVARPRGPQRRDTLLSLFWPETDDVRGRQVLRQSLYLLRQSLGADAIKSRGDEDVEVQTALVCCDVVQFEQAIAEGRLVEALDWYRGDFLRGFHPPDAAPELEHWIAEERQRLRAMAVSAARTLASREERTGNPAEALRWARRAVALDRDSEEAVRELMLFLARVGDRAGAATVFEHHARRLREEFGLEPGGEVVRVMTALRGAPSPVVPPEAAAAPSKLSPPSGAAGPPAEAAGQATTPRRRRPARALLLAAGAVLAAGALALFLRTRPASSATPVLAVGPMVEMRGADSIGENAVAGDLLATSLARLPGLNVIPQVRLYDVQSQLRAVGSAASPLAAAQYAGAGRLLRGTLHRGSRSGLVLEGQLLNLASGSVERAFRAEGGDLFELVDHATEAVAGILGTGAPSTSISEVTTRSLTAYRLYQDGVQAFYSWDLHSALGLFRAAMDEDSTFPMATYYAGLTLNALSLPQWQALMSRAAQLAQRAPDRERLLIRYRVASQLQTADAAALAETLSVRYPSDLDAVAAAGTLRQRAGDWPGAAARFRRLVALDSLSLHVKTARCFACEAYVELWWTAIYADSMKAAERAAREWMARQGRRGPIVNLLAIALERQGRLNEALGTWQVLYDSIEPTSGALSLRRTWLAIREGNLTLAEDRVRALLHEAPAAARSEYAWWLAIILQNQARLKDGLELDLDPRMRGLFLLDAGRYREAATVFQEEAESSRRANPLSPRPLAWNLTHVATALAAAGDTARLPALADSVERIGALSLYGRDLLLHHYIRGLLWLARGDTTRAAEAFRSAIWSWTDGYTRANYELSKAWLALRRPRDAIYPLQAALRGDLQASNLYVARTELHELLGRAFEQTGQRDSAAVHYDLVARAWDHGDAPFAARARAARTRVAVLRH
jgi:DNA-binding SARP family transcriptional activator